MGVYATGTTVPVEKSRTEIETILSRYGATAFAYASSGTKVQVFFEAKGRRIRFDLSLPSDEEAKISKRVAQSGHLRTPKTTEEAKANEMRRRWRCLALVIKAKLEAVTTGISDFEEEFLAHIVLPNGQSIGQWLLPQIGETYRRDKMPPLLGDGR